MEDGAAGMGLDGAEWASLLGAVIVVIAVSAMIAARRRGGASAATPVASAAAVGGDDASGAAARAAEVASPVSARAGEAVSLVTTRRRGDEEEGAASEEEGAASEVEALLGGYARGFRRGHVGTLAAPIQVAPPTVEIDGGGEAVGMRWRGIRTSASGRSQHELALVSVSALRADESHSGLTRVDLRALQASSGGGRGAEVSFGREVEDALADFAAPPAQARPSGPGEPERSGEVR
ncbi:MAG: hypothetical protein IPK80_15350 [Nannocystis sp.]|nr:hypothetical protein [Nannocystis sp.]